MRFANAHERNDDTKKGVIVWPVQAKPFCGSVPGNRSEVACLDAAHLSVIQKVGKARTVMAGAASAVSASAVAPIKGKKGEGIEMFPFLDGVFFFFLDRFRFDSRAERVEEE
jgi:hypothetical protein